jgi:DNA-binding XRE family transcriptional regulator
MKPGESFSKTWRLVNSGTCVWTNSYAVVWFSGEDIGVTREQFFITQVKPGQAIDVTVDMIAPEESGTYQSNWKLRNQAGNLFGIGPNGGAPFWAKIVVTEVSTPTPTELPSQTPTPEALVSGVVSLEVDNALDLDTGEMNTGSNDDIQYVVVTENQPQIQPLNGAKLALPGTKQPSETICKTSALSEAAINLAEMKEGSYLCYTTGQGLHGYVRVTLTSLAENILTLEYLTWANP